MFNLDLIYPQNPSNSCLGWIKIDMWVRGNIFHDSWTGFVFNLSGGDTRSIISSQSTMYHPQNIRLGTCSTRGKKPTTYLTPICWTNLVNWALSMLDWTYITVYITQMIEFAPLWMQYLQNRCILIIFCIVFSGVNTCKTNI